MHAVGCSLSTKTQHQTKHIPEKEKKNLQVISFWSFHCFLNVEAVAPSVSGFTEEEKKKQRSTRGLICARCVWDHRGHSAMSLVSSLVLVAGTWHHPRLDSALLAVQGVQCSQRGLSQTRFGSFGIHSVFVLIHIYTRESGLSVPFSGKHGWFLEYSYKTIINCGRDNKHCQSQRIHTWMDCCVL